MHVKSEKSHRKTSEPRTWSSPPWPRSAPPRLVLLQLLIPLGLGLQGSMVAAWDVLWLELSWHWLPPEQLLGSWLVISWRREPVNICGVSEIDGNGMLGSCVVIPAFWSAITPVDTWTKISLIYFCPSCVPWNLLRFLYWIQFKWALCSLHYRVHCKECLCESWVILCSTKVRFEWTICKFLDGSLGNAHRLDVGPKLDVELDSCVFCNCEFPSWSVKDLKQWRM